MAMEMAMAVFSTIEVLSVRANAVPQYTMRMAEPMPVMMPEIVPANGAPKKGVARSSSDPTHESTAPMQSSLRDVYSFKKRWSVAAMNSMANM